MLRFKLKPLELDAPFQTMTKNWSSELDFSSESIEILARRGVFHGVSSSRSEMASKSSSLAVRLGNWNVAGAPKEVNAGKDSYSWMTINHVPCFDHGTYRAISTD